MDYNIPAYLCSIDLTKTFGQVKLKNVTAALQEEHTPEDYIKLIDELSTEKVTQLKVKLQCSLVTCKLHKKNDINDDKLCTDNKAIEVNC